jgi:hypothetical protein
MNTKRSRNEGDNIITSISATREFVELATERADAAGMNRSAFIVETCLKAWKASAPRAKRPGRPKKKTVKR